MGYSEVKEYKTINTSLDRSENGEVLAYKIGQQHDYPYMLISVSGAETKEEFNKFLHEKGYVIKTLRGMVGKTGYMTYLKTPMGDLKIGYLSQSDLSILLNDDVFIDFNLTAYLDSRTKIEGDLVYAMV